MTDDQRECPICLEQLPVITFRGNECSRMLCCGYLLCNKCAKEYQPYEVIRSVTNDEDRREKCPLCRVPLPRNSIEGLPMVQNHADKGKAWAQYNLGNRYETGRGMEKSMTKAAEWFLKAADQGYTPAEFAIGARYENGEGVPRDISKAEEYYQKAAENGYAKAQFNLGLLYKQRNNQSKRALDLFLAAAKQNFDCAECELGYSYEHGECGVAINIETAKFWYRKAAAQGNETALMNLGSIDFNNEEFAKALFWLRKVAVKGTNSDALQLLSQLESVLKAACFECRAPLSGASRCSRCKTYFYCGRECQVKHWRKTHKRECAQVQEFAREFP